MQCRASLRQAAAPRCHAHRQLAFRTALPVRRAAVAARTQRHQLVVSAVFDNGSRGLGEQVERMFKRYDFLSTGAGVMVVTGYCWMRGQDPATALAITAVATITALVANELLFAEDQNN